MDGRRLLERVQVIGNALDTINEFVPWIGTFPSMKVVVVVTRHFRILSPCLILIARSSTLFSSAEFTPEQSRSYDAADTMIQISRIYLSSVEFVRVYNVKERNAVIRVMGK